MAKTSQTELELLEQSRVALENATTNPEIAAALAEVGYDEAKIQEGKALLTTAQNAYDSNKGEGVEASLAYDTFDQKRQELETAYRTHRKRAKVYFSDNPSQLVRLNVHKPIFITYLAWMDSVKLFYAEATTNPEVVAALQTLKITEQELLSTHALIPEVEALRKTYIDEKGQAQNATKTKDQALKALEQWMRSFYKIAAIALDDQPQLIESLSKVIKS